MSNLAFEPEGAVFHVVATRPDGRRYSLGDVARTPDGEWGFWQESGGMESGGQLAEIAAFIRHLEQDGAR